MSTSSSPHLEQARAVHCPTCFAEYPPGSARCPEDGTLLVTSTVLEAQRVLPPGSIVGEYRIEKLLGEGTFGHVYRAVHPIIGRGAAIKVLKPAFSSDPEMLGRFVEEARAANKIRHRGIIDIFGFGALPDGRHYYVMEMLSGLTLDAYRTQRGAIDLSELLPLLRSIARAMDAAHAAGVVHRDLKPANVFLCLEEDQLPRPKVLDFGIAKLLSTDTRTNTLAGTPLGTPHYMSPEQSRGLAVDKATDVYAFGVMVFELLTGTMPFDGDTAMDILMQHIGTPPPRPSDVNPQLSASVNAPILQMLAKDPGARPSSLTVAVEDLAEATGHTWALLGPKNSSQATLVALTNESVLAATLLPVSPTPPPRVSVRVKPESAPISAPVDVGAATMSDATMPVLAQKPTRTRALLAVGAGISIVALLVTVFNLSRPQTSSSPNVASQLPVAVAPPSVAPLPSVQPPPAAASVSPVSSAPLAGITPRSTSLASPASSSQAVRPDNKKNPRPPAGSHSEIDNNPY